MTLDELKQLIDTYVDWGAWRQKTFYMGWSC